MNKLLLEIGRINGMLIGILDMYNVFPARYYAGFIRNDEGRYHPADNRTYFFHRSQDAALDAGIEYFENEEKLHRY